MCLVSGKLLLHIQLIQVASKYNKNGNYTLLYNNLGLYNVKITEQLRALKKIWKWETNVTI